MFQYQPLGWRDPIVVEVTNELLHIDSELCWCDPIIEVDQDGKAVVIHKEVTWN